ncbi:autotransporter domain-containing protein [Alcaligenaceae bacterium]|nr:autotransporter domain-containing protein [Alcaligenaceae bacterium]
MATAQTTLSCTGGVCTPADPPKGGTHYISETTAAKNTWVVKATGADTQIELNGGSVTAHGSKNRAVGAHGGAEIIMNGVDVITDASFTDGSGWGGHGVQAHGGSIVQINDSTITTAGASYSLGIQSQEAGKVEGHSNTIVTSAAGSSGVEADTGGSIDLTGGSITTGGANAAGARALSGKGGTERGTITLGGTAVTTTGVGAIGLMAGDEDGPTGPITSGDITYSNGTVAASGSAARVRAASVLKVTGSTLVSATAHGVDASSRGGAVADLPAKAELTDTHVVVNGSATTVGDVVGILAADAANVELTRGSVKATGANKTRGILATTGATVTTTNTDISTTGANSHAVHAHNQMGNQADRPRITLSGGKITTTGDESWGLYALRGGQINAEGVNIETSGKAGFGAFVESNEDSRTDGGKITLTDSSIKTTGGLIFTATGPVEGIGSHGVVAKHKGNSVELTRTHITTTGPRADGLRAELGATISATGAKVITTGDTSAGVYLTGNSSVTLTDTVVEASGASIVSDLGAGGDQTINVLGSSVLKVNNGTLLLVKRTSAVDGTVKLTLGAGTYAWGNVVNHDLTGTVIDSLNTIIDPNGGHWAGIKVTKATKVVVAGGTETVTGDLTGDIAGSQGSTVDFTATNQTLTGTLSSGPGSTVNSTGNLTVTGQVLGQPGATMNFSGPSTEISSGVTGVGSSFQFGGSTDITGGLAGSGSSFVFGGGSTTITGGVQLDDNATLRGGTSGAPIQITGDVGVNSGATLGGNLNVSGALTGTNGILGPGNSTGIQTYGSLGAFTGTYLAEVNALGQSDLIRIATGDADLSTIALLVRQENGNGGYVLNHDYTILETVGGNVVNTFSSTGLDDSFANALVKLDPVKYGAKDVKISLVADTSKVAAARPGLSGNQNAVLDGVLSVAGQNSSADAVMLMGSAEERNNALNQLSGEVHGSTQSALHSSGGLLVSTIGNRMRGNVGAGMLAGAPTADASGSAVAGSMPRSAAYPLWAEVVGNWNTLDGDDNAAETKSHTAGIYVGGDTAVGNGWRVGGALGFTDGRIKADSVGSRSDVRSYTATVYGGNQWAAGNGQVNFLAGAGYTRHNIDSRRSINVGGSQTLKADYHANTVQLFTELGYAMPVGQVSTIEPYAGVAWSSQRTKDFTETGGSAALHGKGQTDDVTTLTLGLRGTTLMAVGQHDARLSAGLGWRHASGDVNANRTMSFVQGGGAAFTVAGAPIAKNAAVVDLGAEVDVGKNAAMGLAYSGQFGNGSTDSTGSLYLKVRF